MNKIVGLLKSRSFILIIYLFILLLFFGAYFYSVFTPLENKIYDFFLNLKYIINPVENKQIILINIDDNTINELGDWPIKRSYYAEVIEKLQKSNIRALGIDVIFSQARDKKEDQAFIKALEKYDNIVLPVVADLSMIRNMHNNIGDEIQVHGFEKPFKRFAEKSHLAHINFFPDSDGIIRNIETSLGDSNQIYTSFAHTLAELAYFNDLHYKTSETSLISFTGPAHTIEQISFMDILKDNFDQDLISDKIVIIGVNISGFGDRFMTSFSQYGYLTGSQIHAQALYSILNQDLKYRLDYYINVLILIIFAVIFILLFKYFSPFKSFFILILTICLYTAIYLKFFSHNIVLDYISPLTLIFLVYVLSTINWYLREQGKRLKLQTTFEPYLSTAIMKRIMEDPTNIKLGGDKTYLTVLFLDIRNFTEFAEKRSAEEVVKSLNNTFRQISSLIIANQGTIDKYLGDGIMAFFSAPISVDKHQDKAVKTALEIEELDLDFKLGIGINTGYAIAGNIGSSDKIEYTVIGDVVNKAARFVELAKAGEIIIGEESYQGLSDYRKLFWQKRKLNLGLSREEKIYSINIRELSSNG